MGNMSITIIMYLTGYAFVFQGQDDHLLESPGSVQFLMKLLKPIVCIIFEQKYQYWHLKEHNIIEGKEHLQPIIQTGNKCPLRYNQEKWQTNKPFP